MSTAKRFTPRLRARFLERLRQTGNVTEAAGYVGLSRSRLYDLRARDPDLAREWRLALEDTTDRLEAEAIRRAMEGVEEPYFYQGKECGTVRKYSDSLMKFLLQARLPGRYAEDGDGDESGSASPAVVFEMHFGPEPGEAPEELRGEDDHEP